MKLTATIAAAVIFAMGALRARAPASSRRCLRRLRDAIMTPSPPHEWRWRLVRVSILCRVSCSLVQFLSSCIKPCGLQGLEARPSLQTLISFAPLRTNFEYPVSTWVHPEQEGTHDDRQAN